MSGFLRDLDARLVPRASEALDRGLRRVGLHPKPSVPVAVRREAARKVRPVKPAPLPAIVRLRALDDRWTASGPLALFREVPQLVGLVIGVLVLVAGATGFSRSRNHGAATTAGTGPGGTPVEIHVGPDIGESVKDYVNRSRANLSQAVIGGFDREALAVVDFTKYRTPADVAKYVSSLTPIEAFYRIPVKLGLTQPRQVYVKEGLVTALRGDMQAEATRLDAAAGENRRVAATMTRGDPEKKSHLDDAAEWVKEAKILRGRCACVYAVVVKGPLRLIAPLLGHFAIRAVDPTLAKLGTPGLTFTGLLPEEKKIVTGGNQSAT